MRPHPTDLLSLTFGLVFLGIAALWLAHRLGSHSPTTVAMLTAAGLVGLGVLGMVFAWRAGRRAPDRASAGQQPGAEPGPRT